MNTMFQKKYTNRRLLFRRLRYSWVPGSVLRTAPERRRV
jgi:hypothetical protein